MIEKKEIKKIFKVFIIAYLVAFLVINWNDISWLFNYRVIKRAINDFFTPYPAIDPSSLQPYLRTTQKETRSSNTNQDTYYRPSFKESTKDQELEIPKLSLSLPLIFAKSTDKKELVKDLERGVVYYPGSVLPGERGQIIILGHSAPPHWPKIKYDWAFSRLFELERGDTVLIHFRKRMYTYLVVEKTIIHRGANLPFESLNPNTNTLILISCWPPGKDYQRIVIRAEILSQ